MSKPNFITKANTFRALHIGHQVGRLEVFPRKNEAMEDTSHGERGRENVTVTCSPGHPQSSGSTRGRPKWSIPGLLHSRETQYQGFFGGQKVRSETELEEYPHPQESIGVTEAKRFHRSCENSGRSEGKVGEAVRKRCDSPIGSKKNPVGPRVGIWGQVKDLQLDFWPESEAALKEGGWWDQLGSVPHLGSELSTA